DGTRDRDARWEGDRGRHRVSYRRSRVRIGGTVLIGETVRTAVRSLASNRLRTALTALGMVIGVAAVIAVLAVGEGARASIEGQIRALGTNLLYVRPGSAQAGPVRTGSAETLTRADARAIAALPGVVAIAPERGASAQIEYLDHNQNAQVQG